MKKMTRLIPTCVLDLVGQLQANYLNLAEPQLVFFQVWLIKVYLTLLQASIVIFVDDILVVVVALLVVVVAILVVADPIIYSIVVQKCSTEASEGHR